MNCTDCNKKLRVDINWYEAYQKKNYYGDVD